MSVLTKLIERLKQKDEEAFDKIYDMYSQLVFYVLRIYIKDHDICQELMQEVFTKMFKEINKLRNNSSFKSWLTAITKNIALEYLNKEKKNKNYVDSLIYNNEFASIKENDISDYFTENLKELERSTLVLKIVYDFTFKEISKELNISIDIVTKAYYSGLDKIRKEYLGGEVK